VSDSLMFAQAVGLTVPLTIDTSNGAGTNSSSAQ